MLRKKSPYYHITLQGCSLPCRVGVSDHERSSPQCLRVAARLRVVRPEEDTFESVVCYDQLAQKMRAWAREAEVHLLETVAGKLLEICLEDQRVQHARVTVEKMGKVEGVESVSVTLKQSQRPKGH